MRPAKLDRPAGIRRPPPVCIVSGDREVVSSLERLLHTNGFAHETFVCAEAYLHRPPDDSPSCLLLDLHLPDMGGLDLQDRIVRDGAQTPIIFLSALADVRAAVRAMRNGAADFLMKPPDDVVILSAVSAAVDRDAVWRQDQHRRQDARRRLSRLTPREREVADRVAEGLLNKQIAAEMGVSEQTVKIHRARMMRKLAVGSVPDLVRFLVRCE